MHLSYIILIAAGLSLFFSFISATLRNSAEKVKDFLDSKVSAEDTEKRYDKYNRLKKWFFSSALYLHWSLQLWLSSQDSLKLMQWAKIDNRISKTNPVFNNLNLNSK